MADGDLNTLHWHSAVQLLDEETSNREKPNEHTPEDADSDFGDSDCGEPLHAQRLQLDFTPDEEIDNEYAQKKCCMFWDFVNSQPQLKHIIVYPEKQHPDESEQSVSTRDSSKSDKEEMEAKLEKTAVSMLELVQEKGYIDRTFEAKMPQSMCSLGSREYKELEDPTQQKKKKKHGPCQCARPYCWCKKLSSNAEEIKTMVKDMEKWDATHPKSMEPPGHPPSLQHCILQRARYSIPPL